MQASIFTPNNLLKYSILALIMLNVPGFTLVHVNPVLSSMLSYLSFGLLIVFYITNKRTGVNAWLLILGLLHFTFGSLVDQSYMPPLTVFLIYCIKHFIYIICGHEVLKRTTNYEFLTILFIGAISIILQIFFFNSPFDYGRYSGFYLNPNGAGFICILGYGLSYSLGKSKIKIVVQLIFTFMGLLTLSRTFIVLWILINLMSIRLDIKNIYKLALGVGVMLALLTYNAFLPVKNPRISQLSGAIEGDAGAVQDLNEGSRLDTWGYFYDALLERPFFGNGIGAFGGDGIATHIGVHNSYLKIWGESGIIPFLLFVSFFIFLLTKSYKNFSRRPHHFFMVIALTLFLAANHNYFDSGFQILACLWLYAQISSHKNSSELNLIRTVQK